MHSVLTHFLVFCFIWKIVDPCVATSAGGVATTTAAPSTCQSCLLSATEIINISEGTKDFTSDTIDTSGTCAIRTSVCDGFSATSQVLITFNYDQAGQNNGTGTATSVLICNDAGQWTKDGIVITAIECQSTP
uniref:C6 domain-containing protein n=1 Tax=Caenorhabditis tropicalis TaxID=1561998 RepID=A0A1I7U0G2_9PELO